MTPEEFIAHAGVPIAAVVFVLGLLGGSFLNVVIARVPRGESVVRPRSRCPHCGYMIPSWLNVPVLSWIVLRGRCGACKTPISIRYPTVELLTGLLFLACFRVYGLTWALLLGFILSASLVAITWIDIDIFEIPDEISLPGILVGAILRPIAFDVPWWSGWVAAALAAAAILGLRWGFAAVRGIEGMGLGDVKLLAMIGAFLGPGALLPVLLAGSLSGIVIGGPVALAARFSGKDEEAPSAPGAADGDVGEGVVRPLLLIQAGARTWRLGAPHIPGTRSHLRAAAVLGARRRGGRGFLRLDVLRLLVGAQAKEAGMANAPFPGEFSKGDLRHQLRLDPARAARFGPRHIERRLLDAQHQQHPHHQVLRRRAAA